MADLIKIATPSQVPLNGASATPSVPDEVKIRRHAVVTLDVKPDGKLDKNPLHPVTLRQAKTSDIDTLGTYEQAMDALRRGRAKAAGPVLKRCGLFCLDLDNCHDPATGEISLGASLLVARFAFALITISVSGTGLHIWLKASPPRGMTEATKTFYLEGQKVEFLAEKFVAENWTPYWDGGQIKPFQEELDALYNELKPAPKPATPPAPIHTNGSNGHDKLTGARLEGFLRHWRSEMEATPDGEKHNKRIALARTAAGYLHYGHYTEADIENALSVNITGDESVAMKAIRDGIGYGKPEPLELPPPDLQHEKRAFIGGQSPYESTLSSPLRLVPSATLPDEPSDNEPADEVTPTKSRFRILTSEEIKDRPDPEYLVDNFLVENALAALVAEFESFKTFQTISLAGAIANGLPWYGRETQKKPVLIISGEGSGGLKARVTAWEIRHQCPMNCHFLPEAVQMLDSSAVFELVAAIRELPEMPGLIVIDTVARCLVGGDENSAKDMGLMVAGADYIRRETGAAVLLVHHVGKNGDTRGSTALPGAVDTIIRLRRNGDAVAVECEKQKESEHFETFQLVKRVVGLPGGRSSLIFDLDTAPVAKPESKAERIKEQMLEILRTQFPAEGARAKEWQEKCENARLGKSRAFYNHVDEMAGNQIEKVSGSWQIKGTASTANLENAVQMQSNAQDEEVLQKSTAFPPLYKGECSTCSTDEVPVEMHETEPDSEDDEEEGVY